MAIPFSQEFDWPNGQISFTYAIKLSISNSFSSSYDSVKVLTEFGNTLSLLQLAITFVFLTIILSNSIPQIKSE